MPGASAFNGPAETADTVAVLFVEVALIQPERVKSESPKTGLVMVLKDTFQYAHPLNFRL